jgi:hypothetical protein
VRLDTLSNADLQGLGYLVSPDEAAILKSSFSDFDQLRTIFAGTANLSVAKDFMAFGKLLTGVV